MDLADYFIQSDLHCIARYILSVFLFLEIKPITLGLIALCSTAYRKNEYEIILCSSSYFMEMNNRQDFRNTNI